MTIRTRKAPLGAVVTLTAVATLLLSACGTSAQAHWTQAGSAPSSTGTASAATGSASGPAKSTGPGKVVISPSVSTGVTPATPVTVTASAGATVTAVSLTTGSKTVAGTLSSDGLSWKATGALAFNTKYTLKVTSSTSATPTTTTFTTVKPTKTTSVHLIANKLNALKSGGTYGVGEAVMVHFSHSIPSSAHSAVEKMLNVSVSPAPVAGRWHWVSSDEVDYRGENYWAAGSTITISAKTMGVSLGSGAYLSNSASATIHIGDSHVLIADNATHRMQLFINGTLTKTIKVSMGMGGSTTGANGQLVNYWTRTGPHVVIQKSPSVTMSSASYGITDPKSKYYYAPETVLDAVRISYSGEFVHLRTWTVHDIGVRNTSHGCINVGKDYASYLYGLLITGDIVDVKGTPVPISSANSVAVWETPWAQWT